MIIKINNSPNSVKRNSQSPLYFERNRMKIILLIIFSTSIFCREPNWENYWNNYSKYSKQIQKWCKVYDIDTNIFKAMIIWENRTWNPTRKGLGGFGLCQVAGGSSNPDSNIKQACIKLSDNLKIYGNYYHALIGYNCGTSGAKSKVRNKIYWEYSTKILWIAQILRTLDHDIINRWRRTWDENDYDYYLQTGEK